MKTLIVLSNQHVDSVTKHMLEEFMKSHKENNEIDILDLYAEGIDFLRNQDLALIMAGEDNSAKKYAEQLLNYNKVVFVYPFWNFTFPAIIKAYIDYISYAGITFKYTEEGPVGLLNNTKFTTLVASGGYYGENPSYRYDVGYLSHVANFLGGEYIEGIRCEGTNIPGHIDRVRAEALKDSHEFGMYF